MARKMTKKPAQIIEPRPAARPGHTAAPLMCLIGGEPHDWWEWARADVYLGRLSPADVIEVGDRVIDALSDEEKVKELGHQLEDAKSETAEMERERDAYRAALHAVMTEIDEAAGEIGEDTGVTVHELKLLVESFRPDDNDAEEIEEAADKWGEARRARHSFVPNLAKVKRRRRT